jgi:hypothetical protein
MTIFGMPCIRNETRRRVFLPDDHSEDGMADVPAGARLRHAGPLELVMEDVKCSEA